MARHAQGIRGSVLICGIRLDDHDNPRSDGFFLLHILPHALSFRHTRWTPMKDLEDKRLELVGYYRACEPYLTNDMRIAINNEDVKGFGMLVSRLTASNPDGTVARRDPGWEELFDFEIKFEEYLEMKNKNAKTEHIIKELEQTVKNRNGRRK